MMRYNSGEAFVHPVTHQTVQSGEWYEGAAHQVHENENLQAVEDVLTEGATDVHTCEYCGKEYKTQKGLSAHSEQCSQKLKGEQSSGDEGSLELTPQEQGQVRVDGAAQ